MKSRLYKISIWFLTVIIAISFLTQKAIPVYAAKSEFSVNGRKYIFDNDNEYVLKDAKSVVLRNIDSLGKFKISGSASEIKLNGGIQRFDVSNGNLDISYTFNKKELPSKDSEWHIKSDNTKSINNVKLSKKIDEGAILVETSLDGKNWIKSKEQTNYFSSNSDKPIYTTSEIQLLNGCYYRITVVYEQERVSGNSKILFVNKKDKEHRRIAEVYEFYAVNSKAQSEGVSSAQIKPREELGKLVNAGNNDGYSKTDAITKDDIHYGWTIGTFTINGFTQKQGDDNKPVFLKNVGDQVTLWFTLQQDINKLNNNSDLSIADDKKGYDEKFQTPKTDMGRGTLIIGYTDTENHKHAPVIYTDYLDACSTTSADTRVVLYEEGDYEVALDYKVKGKLISNTKIPGVSVVGKTYDYRVSFKFSVHNSNAMLYPFDIKTGSELQNRAVTSNGFRIDLANSKDLDVFVTHSVITENGSGRHIEDNRGTKAAKDGSTYTKSGIYTLEVENTYTKQQTTKTIYVGDDPFLVALANSGLTVDELDDALASGYVIDENGNLTAPNNPQPAMEEKVNEAAKKVEKEAQAEAAASAATEAQSTNEISEENTAKSSSSYSADANKKQSESKNNLIIPIISVAVVIIIIGIIVLKKKKNK